MITTQLDTPAGARWQVSYYVSAKKGNDRKRFKTAKEAAAFGKFLKKSAKLQIPWRIAHSSPARLADLDEALMFLGEGNFKVSTAVAHYIEHVEDKRKLVPSPEFDELLDGFLESRGEWCREVTIRSYRSALRSLKTLSADAELIDMTSGGLRSALAGASISNVSRNTYLTHARPFFAWLVEKRYLASNPVPDVKRFKVAKVDPCIYSAAETERLLRAVESEFPRLVRAYAISLFAGIRPAAVSTLTDADIRLEEGVIRVGWAQDKTEQKYFAKIQGNLKAWLEKYDSQQIMEIRTYQRGKIGKKADLPHGHDIFRHTFASHHLARFESSDQTAHALNHRNTAMLYKHYRSAVSPAEGRRFFEIMP